jgi:epoxyqueuosine reductase QueG
MNIEEKIKSIARATHDRLLVGVAGPGRFDGPPSVDPTYTLPGAKSIVSIAIPMYVPAIYEFFSKKTPLTHNADQLHGNQAVFRISEIIAEYLRSLGYRAKAAPVNSDYRRNPDPLSHHPAFSHRYGALVTGIAGQGWSGNAVTREYGGAVYLGTVMTDATLRSDPMMDAREIVEERCSHCKLCAKSCPVGMFDGKEEDQYQLNSQRYPRGKRINVDLCVASCFGLHALSRTKKWSTWSDRWIDEWVDGVPNPRDRRAVRRAFAIKSVSVGDSGRRATLIQKSTLRRCPGDVMDNIPTPDRSELFLNDDYETVRKHREQRFLNKLGIYGLESATVLTCGQCSSVCGPTQEERTKRYRMITQSGIVVHDGQGGRTVVATYDEALRMRSRYGEREVPAVYKLFDRMLLAQYVWRYSDLDPRSHIARHMRRRKRRQARR